MILKNEFIPSLIKAILPKEKTKINIEISDKISLIYELVGRFCDFKSFFPFLETNLKVKKF